MMPVPFVVRLCGFASLSLLASTGSFAQKPEPVPLIAVEIPAKSLPVADLIKQLKLGGHVLLIRHERTEVPSVADDYTKPTTDCRSQRNLSASGFAGAQETRVALRALAIPVARTVSSPMCRATETARQMFVTYDIDLRLMHEMNDQGRTNDVAGADLQRVLDDIKGTAGNVALVTHAGLIQRATGLRLPEGGIAVLKYQPSGWVLIKQIIGSDLGPHAREALGAVKP
jgi:broad specificity phosphatase PhoE